MPGIHSFAVIDGFGFGRRDSFDDFGFDLGSLFNLSNMPAALLRCSSYCSRSWRYYDLFSELSWGQVSSKCPLCSDLPDFLIVFLFGKIVSKESGTAYFGAAIDFSKLSFELLP